MTLTQLNNFKQRLLKLQQGLHELEEEFAQSGETVILDQNSVGRLSRMDAMQSQQMSLEASRRREMQADNIEGGLRRIESGQYGFCFYCEEAIDIKRLDADPTYTRCLKCAD
ncbi:TraR/DksA C4-type zinc finger protein [Cocleimonas flava]|uniref:TraR/DksA family transcriptional regulator n=1 Tax=Cocleimonas flava TaxID=634765 RepID=A0A4V2P955_9GAMM|nr:TraR/DksA family transcriptional regulator [Cocleimonas flava]TCJ88275.1 TraR/DksA family transcriptional regulator [Cocleimonas flava]